jgi:haloacetate dehalogenase
MVALQGFEPVDVEVPGGGGEAVTIHAEVGGEGAGPPVLLLHGYPQTHAMWHRVAPGLAEHHRVVAADLRGYGDSSRPASDATHAAYSKRATATDQVALMTALGHERWAVVGHDRGARVAHRMCLDHPGRVTRAALLDIAPSRHVWATVDTELALAYDHWFFLAQETALPERLVGAEPELWLRTKLGAWSGAGAAFDEAAVAEYVRCFDAAGVHASTEDYRAGATIDREHDEADADARVACPLLVLWGADGLVGRRGDPLETWRGYADDVRGHAVPGGHFVPEEAPAETLAALLDHLAPPA